MRTSWKKLQKGLLSRSSEAKERRERRLRESMGQFDELTRAYQDMQDMRDCYDSILSAAAATANSAYELSESLKDMGTCLLEKTASYDDEESGKVFLMLGKIQFELHKLVDNYRSHIFQTITVPSESLLSELRTVEKLVESKNVMGSSSGLGDNYARHVLERDYFLSRMTNVVRGSVLDLLKFMKCREVSKLNLWEEMKRQCDEKRYIYEFLMSSLRQKGRPRSSKGDSSYPLELRAAHNDFEGMATKVVFRVDSLKKGQSRSLLTQAVRHHAAQLCFFKKAFGSLETAEPHLKLVTEQQHIDCRFTSHEYDDSDDEDDDTDEDEDDDNQLKNDDNENGSTENDNANKNAQDNLELSSECRHINKEEVVSAPGSSMEFDCLDLPFRKATRINTSSVSKENLDRKYGEDVSPSLRELESRGLSSPLSAGKSFDTSERFRHLRPSFAWKFASYALPTPAETKGLVPSASESDLTVAERKSLSKGSRTSSLSSPLEQSQSQPKSDNPLETQKVTAPSVLSQPPPPREINDFSSSFSLPTPSSWELSAQRLDQLVASETKRFQRHAFSGPLTSRGTPIKVAASGSPVVSEETTSPKGFSAPLLRTQMHRASSSPRLSPSGSPTSVSLTKISELHELPRPPTNIRSRLSSKVGYSGPLMSKGQGNLAASKLGSSSSASPLPTPPRTVSRSFSIPSRGQRLTITPASSLSEARHTLEMAKEIVSPSRAPDSSSDCRPSSPAPKN